MKPKLLQFSLVVRGETHNPSILNPDFLSVQGIVPTSWKWESRQTMTTPMASSVEYANHVSIQVTAESLQVVGEVEDGDSFSDKIPEVARRYVETLPHVRYTALGINFHSALSVGNPGESIRDRFMTDGPWRSEAVAAGVRLEYALSDGRLRISVDGGKRGEEEAILVCANFHRDLTEHPATDQIKGHLDRVQADLESYNETLASLFKWLK